MAQRGVVHPGEGLQQCVDHTMSKQSQLMLQVSSQRSTPWQALEWILLAHQGQEAQEAQVVSGGERLQEIAQAALQ